MTDANKQSTGRAGSDAAHAIRFMVVKVAIFILIPIAASAAAVLLMLK